MVTPAPHAEQRAPRVLVSVAAVSVAALDALYLAIIRSQGDTPPSPYVVPFIASFLAGIAAALFISLFAPSAARALLRGSASGGLIVLTVLTALSIGVAVLVATVLCVAGTVISLSAASRRRDVVVAAVSAIVAGVVLLVGLQLAWAAGAA